MDQEEFHSAVERLRNFGSNTADIEAKSCAGDLSKNVWDSVSAFANTSGGLLLLGLDEKSGFTVPLEFEPDKIIDQFVTGMGDGGSPSKLTSTPRYSIERHELDGQQLVAIRIDENPPGQKPCYITAKALPGGAFRRVDDKDILLSSLEIFEFQHQIKQLGSDREPVPESTVDDLDPTAVASLIKSMEGNRALHGVDGQEQALRRLNIMNPQGTPTLAGMLSTGMYPQQFLPQLIIDVTTHPALTKSPASSPARFLDRTICDGSMAVAIDDAVRATAKNLRTFSIIPSEGTGRRDELEIPADVLREAIANAVVHREYEARFQGTPITVDIYPDRVEVANPGGLWGGKTKDNIADGVSACRNPTLLQLLRRTPFESGKGPTVEGQGSGVPFMINRMRESALEPPCYTTEPSRVIVTLQRHGAEIPEIRQFVQALADRPLSHEEMAAVVLAQVHGSITSATLRQRNGMDSRDAARLLEDLRAEGILRADRTGQYRLATGSPLPTPQDNEILGMLREHGTLAVRELAQLTGRSVDSLRPRLRMLVDQGSVEATAPPTSHHRKYRIPR